MTYDLLTTIVLRHIHAALKNADVDLDDEEKQALRTGLRKLVVDAAARAAYALAIRRRLEEDHVDDVEKLLHSPELRWEVAVESALEKSTDRELIVFAANPLAILALSAHVLENEPDELAADWFAVSPIDAHIDRPTASTDEDWAQQTANRLIMHLMP